MGRECAVFPMCPILCGESPGTQHPYPQPLLRGDREVAGGASRQKSVETTRAPQGAIGMMLLFQSFSFNYLLAL